MSAEMDRLGVLTVADAAAFECLCEAYADKLAARDELKAFGSSYYRTAKDGAVMHRPHPALAVVQNADRRIRAWLVEFGMTPSARSRVKAAPAEQPDPAAKYLAPEEADEE